MSKSTVRSYCPSTNTRVRNGSIALFRSLECGRCKYLRGKGRILRHRHRHRHRHWLARHAYILTSLRSTRARMSVSVSASWNAALTEQSIYCRYLVRRRNCNTRTYMYVKCKFRRLCGGVLCSWRAYLLTARMRSARITPEPRSACRSVTTTPVSSFSR